MQTSNYTELEIKALELLVEVFKETEDGLGCEVSLDLFEKIGNLLKEYNIDVSYERIPKRGT